MRKPVAALFAVFASAFAVVPAAADEMSDLYQQVMADPGNTQLNLKYAAAAEAARKPRLALAAYERILINDPGNPEAQAGMRRVMRALQAEYTRWVASVGAGWESNPANIASNEEESAIALASIAMHDMRYWGSTHWQTDALAVLNLVANQDELNYGFTGFETGPVFDTDSWFTIHPAAGLGISYYDNTTFYTEAQGSLTFEGVKGGANQIARLKFGYRDYASHFTSDGGWYLHLNARWSVPHPFAAGDVLLLSPWFRWSNIEGGVPVSASSDAEPGRYTEFGIDVAYYIPVSESVVLGANVTLSDRNYRDPGFFTGTDDREDTTVTPGATVIFKHIFWYQSDLRLQYRHRDNTSNDPSREFTDDIVTVNLDTRF